MMDSQRKEQLSILMVAPQPFFRARGTPFSVLHRIRALTTAGHRVVLVTYPFGDDIELPGLTVVRSGRPPLIKDVKIGPSFAKIFLDALLYIETVRVLKTDQFDVLHSHEEAAFFAVGLAKRFGLRHIYDMHSSLPQQLSNFGRYNLAPVRSVFERLEKYVLDTCDGVITICPDLGAVVENLCPPTKPHRMIENTADDSKVFQPDRSFSKAEHGLRDKKIILYTGTFEAYQGLKLLLPAFAQVAQQDPSAHLVMVGGRRDQVREVQALVDSMDLTDRVTLFGTVHPSRIPSFLRAAYLIVSPRSSGTNTPLKIYGYLRSGVPLVATSIYSHTQSLNPEIALLVPPTSDGLAWGITLLLSDPDYARQLAKNARHWAERKYSDRRYVESVLEFYQLVFPHSSNLPDKADTGASYGVS